MSPHHFAYPQPALVAHTTGVQAGDVLTIDSRSYTARAHYYYDMGQSLWPYVCEDRDFRTLDGDKPVRVGTRAWTALDRATTTAVKQFMAAYPQWWSHSTQLGRERDLAAAQAAVRQARHERTAIDSRWQQWIDGNPIQP